MNLIDKKINRMTFEEKLTLLTGKDFWATQPILRSNIKSVLIVDGPLGARKQTTGNNHIDLNNSVPVTCYPNGAAIASSWDLNVAQNVARLIGLEARGLGVGLILGPAMNIKRSPLCGRNFEYFSEDPLLSGEMAKNYIQGVQSMGVGACVKHFAANNQETLRFSSDSIVDERALKEIYLKNFEIAIKYGKPWAVMSAYNKLNGVFCSENDWLLNKTLRQEWGFEGIVITDWASKNHRGEGLVNGLDLDMPYTPESYKQLMEYYQTGELGIDQINQSVKRMVEFVEKVKKTKKVDIDYLLHHRLARHYAAECMVLLKNDNSQLPMSKNESFCIIGELAETLRIQGAGSSKINPFIVESFLDVVSGEMAADYSKGYFENSSKTNKKLELEALNLAKTKSAILLFVGIPDLDESEGYDRSSFKLPENQLKLIDKLSKLKKKLVVVVVAGSPVDLSWKSKVDSILYTYLGGQGAAGAIFDIVFGNVNPSGKLAETFPKRIEDTPAYLGYPSKVNYNNYLESIFVGYRYYSSKRIDVEYSFGFGLSYSKFDFISIDVSKMVLYDDDSMLIKVKVKNVGNYKGKEVVQLYVSLPHSKVSRPTIELKKFIKIELDVDEVKTVEFIVHSSDFEYYCEELKDWTKDEGNYEILVGNSSNNLPLKCSIELITVKKKLPEITLTTPFSSFKDYPLGIEIYNMVKEVLLGGSDRVGSKFTESLLDDMTLQSFINFSMIDLDSDYFKRILDEINKIVKSRK